jgi:hypothetical protein
MTGHAITRWFFAFASLAFVTATGAATNTTVRVYPSGAQTILAIGNDLYASLEPGLQKGLNPHAILLEPRVVPIIAPIAGTDHALQRQVSVSQGYIDLLNYIAHAKSIDKLQPGYFKQYVSQLANSTAPVPPPPPNLDDPRYWTDSVMNDQASLFNQMIGMTVAINLSHLYLTHSGKVSQAIGGKLEPINAILDSDEWEASVRSGTLNSLECALATQGAKTLFDCIDQMPQRPAWAAYIVPPGVNIKKLNHELWRYEYDYFHGPANGRHDRPALGG